MKITKEQLRSMIMEEAKKLHKKSLFEERVNGIDAELQHLCELSKKKKRQNIEKQKEEEREEAEKAAKAAEKEGGLKKRQFTDQEIWDAMRGNVHKDKKKEKEKYAGRKDKHKGKSWD